MNWVIYDVMFNVGEVLDFEKYCVDIGNEMLVDILWDVCVIKVLFILDIVDCCVVLWFFG